MTRTIVALATAGVLVAHDASAQEAPIPRVEVGGVVSAIVPFVSDGANVMIGGGPKLTVNIWRGIGIEVEADVVGPTESSGIYGLYLVQVKAPITRSGNGARGFSVTAGVAGAASYHRFDESRTPRPDGSVLVQPGYRRFRADSPNTLVFGIARDYVVDRLVSSTWGVQVLGGGIGIIGVRAYVGLTLGAGSYR